MTAQPHEVDRLVRTAVQQSRILGRAAPVNEEEQKEQFLTQAQEPKFSYGDDNDSYELAALKHQLDTVDLPQIDETIHTLYSRTVEETAARLDTAQHIGDERLIPYTTRQIYGTPSDETIAHAEEILETQPAPDRDAVYSAEEMKEQLDTIRERLGLDDWTIQDKHTGAVAVSSTQKTINVPVEQGYTGNELARLPVHEIGGHVLRAANGQEQPFGILGIGAANYNSVEEGITTFLESVTGTLDGETLYKYAARVKAVESMLEGDSFGQTFDMLRDGYDIDTEKAWRTALRAHRGGGFSKDHIYLQGFDTVTDYIGDSGDLKTLYIGKADIDMLEQLDGQEHISEPAYSPADEWNEIQQYWQDD